MFVNLFSLIAFFCSWESIEAYEIKGLFILKSLKLISILGFDVVAG